ncbi:hypothetical protein ACA097_27820 [Pseudomonas sp. QL9]|uniref:hypothetical protein n=1 Tax=Pseudomonas sp. QL9 TaxID=3242725 RepID=UPI00352B92EE
MATLRIDSWSDDRRWAGENSWPLKAFVYRLGLCTPLKGTALKRAARSLMKKELFEIAEVNPEAANALIHTLESSGAKITILE